MIAFDLDGVLANFIRGFTRIGNRLFRTPVGDATSHQAWMFEHFPELGLDKSMCEEIWRQLDKSPTFWADLDPMNTSVMDRINGIQNKIFVTNRRGIDPQGQSEAFLERWGVTNPRVVVAADKGRVAQEYGITAIIDDYYPNVVDVKTAVPNAFAALLYVPYNKVHHDEWLQSHCGDIVLSVDQYIDACEVKGLIS